MAISIANNYTNIINHQPDGDDIVWSSKLITGFMSTILVILASELGDKTFVLTTLMAMKHNKQSVFLGNLTAALIMICLTIILGLATTFIPKSITHYLGITMFIIFGLQMVCEGLTSSSQLAEITDTEPPKSTSNKSSPQRLRIKVKKYLNQYFSLIFVECFAIRFFAEWGDRSQIALVLLAARENIMGILFGATVGHIICLSLAVIGGGLIARFISPRSVNIIGGWIFLGVAIHTTVKGPES